MAKRKQMFIVRASNQATGQRMTRGRFETEKEADQFIKTLNPRTNSDTKNPRKKKIMGFI